MKLQELTHYFTYSKAAGEVFEGMIGNEVVVIGLVDDLDNIKINQTIADVDAVSHYKQRYDFAKRMFLIKREG